MSTRSAIRPAIRPASRAAILSGGLDEDTLAYFSAIQTAGATVSGPQILALDNFIKAEKSASRWDLIKRLYLPIWGLAAPNAVCLKSLTSGSFVGGVSHGAGFIQGDGTGYFETDLSWAAAGATRSDAFQCIGILTQPSANEGFYGVSDPTGSDFRTERNGPNTRQVSRTGDGFTSLTVSSAATVGIVGLTLDPTEHRLRRRNASGVANLITIASSGNTTAFSWAEEAPFLTYKHHLAGGDPTLPALTSQVFAMVQGRGMSVDQEDAFTLNLKTLWETCTGLTLP